MIKTITNLTKAFYYRWFYKNSKRKAILLSQFHRALALPDWGIKYWGCYNYSSTRKIDVSVIITSFNYSALIKTCLESVFKAAEHKPEIEIIVIDDSSKDNSINKILEFSLYSPVQILIIQTWWNVGVSRARNLAISRAQGEYIFILDADNFILPTALKNLFNLAHESKADAVFGPIKRVNLDGSYDGIVSNMEFDHQYLLNHGNYIDAMAMFHRQKILDIGSYNVSLLKFIGGWEDYELWLNLAKHNYNVAFLKKNIGLYLIKPDSMVKNITTDEMIAFREYAKSNYPGFNAFANLK